ncbi:hypothetical protein [Tepidimonas aquatica]|uniref:DUF4214 domain-containing protein n=1 Tax=Tepidimonas aquatica TaxID=247482 RepID=A0A554WJR3_9BURK|nr:hypothetical protein [Tepidimonas aquatica]TSE23829.1 hypothetical protein Taqua_01716 [Tepidimonas aquatica]
MVSTASQPHRTALIELYIGYFGRAPEAQGLSYWEGELQAALARGDSAAQALAQSDRSALHAVTLALA